MHHNRTIQKLSDHMCTGLSMDQYCSNTLAFCLGFCQYIHRLSMNVNYIHLGYLTYLGPRIINMHLLRTHSGIGQIVRMWSQDYPCMYSLDLSLRFASTYTSKDYPCTYCNCNPLGYLTCRIVLGHMYCQHTSYSSLPQLFQVCMDCPCTVTVLAQVT